MNSPHEGPLPERFHFLRKITRVCILFPTTKNCGGSEQDASCLTVRAEQDKRKQGWLTVPRSTALRACNAACSHRVSCDEGLEFCGTYPQGCWRFLSLGSSRVARPCIESLLFALRSGWLAIRWCFLLFAVRRSGFALFFYDFSLRLALLLYSYYRWSIYHAPDLQ
jgi:hypothetical protein